MAAIDPALLMKLQDKSDAGEGTTIFVIAMLNQSVGELTNEIAKANTRIDTLWGERDKRRGQIQIGQLAWPVVLLLVGAIIAHYIGK
jgi:hypothetical protein